MSLVTSKSPILIGDLEASTLTLTLPVVATRTLLSLFFAKRNAGLFRDHTRNPRVVALR